MKLNIGLLACIFFITASAFTISDNKGYSNMDLKGSLAIKLAELFKNKDKYEGKKIVVTGKVVKVNNGILNRNWVHINDGSKCGNIECDLTITTEDEVENGAQVTFEGKITLNKDFGAGYHYHLIMEEAELKK